MRHRLFTTVVAVSLLLFTAVVVLWVRSQSHFDVVGYGSASGGWTYPRPANKDYAVAGPSGGWTNTWFVGSGEGACLLYAARQTWAPGKPVFGYIETGWINRIGTADVTFLDPNVLPERQTFGFGFQFKHLDGGPNWRLIVPNWSLALATALPPLAWLRAYRRRRWRRRTGRCPACGYDLRATPSQCPECGAGHATTSPSVLVAFAFLALSAAPARAEMTELAEFIVRQNQDARSKLTSFRYDYAREFEQHRPGPRRIRARFKGEWRQRGLEQWVREFRHSQYSDDPKDVQDVERIVVVGKRASAAYHVGTSNPN